MIRASKGIVPWLWPISRVCHSANTARGVRQVLGILKHAPLGCAPIKCRFKHPNPPRLVLYRVAGYPSRSKTGKYNQNVLEPIHLPIRNKHCLIISSRHSQQASKSNIKETAYNKKKNQINKRKQQVQC